jgi:hypothetical protein
MYHLYKTAYVISKVLLYLIGGSITAIYLIVKELKKKAFWTSVRYKLQRTPHGIVAVCRLAVSDQRGFAKAFMENVIYAPICMVIAFFCIGVYEFHKLWKDRTRLFHR